MTRLTALFASLSFLAGCASSPPQQFSAQPQFPVHPPQNYPSQTTQADQRCAAVAQEIAQTPLPNTISDVIARSGPLTSREHSAMTALGSKFARETYSTPECENASKVFGLDVSRLKQTAQAACDGASPGQTQVAIDTLTGRAQSLADRVNYSCSTTTPRHQ